MAVFLRNHNVNKKQLAVPLALYPVWRNFIGVTLCGPQFEEQLSFTQGNAAQTTIWGTIVSWPGIHLSCRVHVKSPKRFITPASPSVDKPDFCLLFLFIAIFLWITAGQFVLPKVVHIVNKFFLFQLPIPFILKINSFISCSACLGLLS